jgi:hypothetical protein
VSLFGELRRSTLSSSVRRLIKLLADAADVYDRNPIYTDDYAIDCGFFTIFVGDLREARQLMENLQTEDWIEKRMA